MAQTFQASQQTTACVHANWKSNLLGVFTVVRGTRRAEAGPVTRTRLSVVETRTRGRVMVFIDFLPVLALSVEVLLSFDHSRSFSYSIQQ